MTNLDSILKRRDITLLTKVPIVKEPGGLWSMGLQSLTWLSDWPTTTMVYTVVMYGCESWIIKKAEHWTIDAFELWCWRRLLRVSWIARRSNQSILKEINPKYSLEGPMLMLKLQYFGHLMWKPTHWKKPWCWERLRARGKGATEDEMVGWHHWFNGYEFEQTQGDSEGQRSLACCSPWCLKVRHDLVTEQQQQQA